MDTIHGYQILKELGKGGMARVYLAKEDGLERLVALKVLRAEIAEESAEEFSQRFLREARMASSLSHPHIVPIYAMRSENDQCFITMEYLPGGDLKSRIMEGLTVEKSLQIIERILDALKYAHGKGITHRDIKPDNIVFREHGDPVLTDFGIAKVQGGNTRLTRTNMVMGTPSYMSPEQFETADVSNASDIYSLGVVLFEMLVGACPYASDSMATAMKKHLLNPIPELPKELAKIQPLINKMLAKSADSRFSAEAAQQEIQRLLSALEKTALEMMPKNIVSFGETISMSTDPSAATARISAMTSTPEHAKTSHTTTIVLGLIGGVIIGIGISYYFIRSQQPVVEAEIAAEVAAENPVEKIEPALITPAEMEEAPVIKPAPEVKKAPTPTVVESKPKPQPVPTQVQKPEPVVDAPTPEPKPVLSAALALKQKLDAMDSVELRAEIKDIYRNNNLTQEEMDVLAQKLWDGRRTEDKYLVDGLAYVCKLIEKRGDVRYKTLMKTIIDEHTETKLRRYAKSAYSDLPKSNNVAQFSPQ